MSRVTIEDCKIINLPKINDQKGNLTFVEGSNHIPFDIKRVYYLYDIPGGSVRGAHAHKILHQVVIAISGSFSIEIDDGRQKKIFNLNRSFHGLYICPMMWRLLDNFSSGAVCLVLASEIYSEEDYIRDYRKFLQLRA